MAERLKMRDLLSMARDSISDPQGTTRRVLALPYATAAWWQALVLLAVLSVLLTQFMTQLIGLPVDPVLGMFSDQPVVMVGVQVVLGVAMVQVMYRVGALFGGQGTLDAALRVTVWLHFVMLGLQIVQTLIILVLPGMAGIAGLVIILINMWLLTNFVAAVHGFRSLLAVFVMVIVTFFVVSFVLLFLLGLLGLAPSAEFPNV